MELFNELNIYLQGKNINDDYWYDNALFVCQDILEEFSIDEWEKLIDDIPKENDIWKKRLVECLGSFHNSYELRVILKIINTENKDLFVACIDSLRCLDLLKLEDIQKKSILKNIEELLISSTDPVKKILEEFLKKIN
ncbi:hypothetical protein [Neisseria sp. Ec49-e6-T10]|uniref:hypothetical protein n=1 Tax=Neisseria sp. Ec49-e6-T10 TaxID=3140744 RepID=UPI003EBCA5A5